MASESLAALTVGARLNLIWMFLIYGSSVVSGLIAVAVFAGTVFGFAFCFDEFSPEKFERVGGNKSSSHKLLLFVKNLTQTSAALPLPSLR